MTSYRQVIYQIVFRTKHSHKTITSKHAKRLYKYIWGIIEKNNCHLYRINGMEEHIHIITDLHPCIALADFIRDIKTASSIWLKGSDKFPDFTGWASGYAALTYSHRDKAKLINYVKNQQIHHNSETFKEEYRRLLKEHNIEIDERYFLK
jgi:REP element-mobilizing transposase RayT